MREERLRPLLRESVQHLGGLEPCELCLKQRYAYYAGVPLLFLALVSLSAGQTRIAALLFGLVALGFLGNAGLGVYHAGVEWKLWAGPTECSGAATLGPAGGLLNRLQDIIVVRCDEAAWRFLGLSLAGYNFLISGLMGLVALFGINKLRTA